MDAVTVPPTPVNEPVGTFAPASPERARLVSKLAQLSDTETDIHHVIGGQHRRSSGDPGVSGAAASPRGDPRNVHQRNPFRHHRRHRCGRRRGAAVA